MRASRVARSALAAAALAAAACTAGGEKGADSLAAADSVAPPRDILPADSGTPASDSVAAPGERPDAGRSEAGQGGAARGGAPSGTPAPAGGASHDSARVVRGTVRRVGSVPTARTVIEPAGGALVTLGGPQLAALRRVSGTEIEVRGVEEAGTLVVQSFTVLSANGERALDGVLERDGEALALRTSSGRIRLPNPPAALRDMIGARIWLTGDPTTGPNAYGVIEPK
jgi:hypothetical protein